MIALVVIAAAWIDHGTEAGITIQSRAEPGTSYETVRLIAKTRVPAEVQAEAIWRGEGPATKEIIEHRVVEQTAAMRIYCEVISAPLIDEREAVIRVERSQSAQARRVIFHSVEDSRCPERSDRIRIRVIGSFEVVPDVSGGSTVIYQVFTDLRGDIPGWIVNDAKRNALTGSLRLQLRRGQEAYAALQ